MFAWPRQMCPPRLRIRSLSPAHLMYQRSIFQVFAEENRQELLLMICLASLAENN